MSRKYHNLRPCTQDQGLVELIKKPQTIMGRRSIVYFGAIWTSVEKLLVDFSDMQGRLTFYKDFHRPPEDAVVTRKYDIFWQGILSSNQSQGGQTGSLTRKNKATAMVETSFDLLKLLMSENGDCKYKLSGLA